ncbi:caspase domain-containing protein [Cyathus striatus]|nr:caspase domain-containing protein [Cyathus striatus]
MHISIADWYQTNSSHSPPILNEAVMADDKLLSATSRLSCSDRSEPAPAIFALVIGINKYMHPGVPVLQAAKGDADAFKAFLVNKLQVPKQNIISLRDEEATRNKIIGGFHQLRDNTDIKKDEAAIVIYYAGHGSRIAKPKEWGDDWITLDDQIEILCPSDIWTPNPNANGEDVIIEGISDRSISVMLNQISSEKGDNITLILDCCFSAGINRNDKVENQTSEDNLYLVRYMPNPPNVTHLSANCDQDIWSQYTRSVAVPQGLSGKYHASHVLLAACGRQQLAHEGRITRRGVFTNALLEILNNSNLEDLTYTSLMHKLQLPKYISRKQVPHCEGQHVNRRLFNRNASGADRSFLLAKKDEDDSIKLQAGTAQGITVDTTFTAHTTNLMIGSNTNRGHLIATSVDAFESRLKIAEGSTLSDLPRSFYCRIKQLAQPKLSIYSNDRIWLESVFSSEQQGSLSVTISDTSEEANLEMIIEKGKVLLYQNNPLITPHIGRNIPTRSIDMTEHSVLRNVARAALHFSYHLNRTGDETRNVSMELMKLRAEHTRDYDLVHKPDSVNLLENDPVTIVVDETERFGMKISNHSDIPLYPYLFYFDPSDFAIIEWFSPPFVVVIRAFTLTIGYGEGGAPPWQFLLRVGDTKDVGFFKLFLTTRATNLSSIAQDSPFDAKSSRTDGDGIQVAPDRDT